MAQIVFSVVVIVFTLSLGLLFFLSPTKARMFQESYYKHFGLTINKNNFFQSLTYYRFVGMGLLFVTIGALSQLIKLFSE